MFCFIDFAVGAPVASKIHHKKSNNFRYDDSDIEDNDIEDNDVFDNTFENDELKRSYFEKIEKDNDDEIKIKLIKNDHKHNPKMCETLNFIQTRKRNRVINYDWNHDEILLDTPNKEQLYKFVDNFIKYKQFKTHLFECDNQCIYCGCDISFIKFDTLPKNLLNNWLAQYLYHIKIEGNKKDEVFNNKKLWDKHVMVVGENLCDDCKKIDSWVRSKLLFDKYTINNIIKKTLFFNISKNIIL